MSNPLYIARLSALDASGITSAKGRIGWDDAQHGPGEVRRDQVLSKPHLSFGKLPLVDKLAFAAGALLLEGAAVDAEKTAICLGIPFGSLSTDLRYMESVVAGFPSPALFSATLPSSPVAELAIYFGLKGPNRVVSQGNSSGLCALITAIRLLRQGKARMAVVVSVSALEEADRGSVLLAGAGSRPNTAYGLLLASAPIAGALNRRLVVGQSTTILGVPSDHDDVYFVDLIDKLVRGDNGSVAFPVGQLSGTMTLEKDE